MVFFQLDTGEKTLDEVIKTLRARESFECPGTILRSVLLWISGHLGKFMKAMHPLKKIGLQKELLIMGSFTLRMSLVEV